MTEPGPPPPELGEELAGDQEEQPAPELEEPPRFVLWMVLNLFVSFICPLFLLGMPGFALALVAKSEWDSGNTEASIEKLRYARVLGSLSVAVVALAVIGIVFYIVSAVVMVGAGEQTTQPSY